MPYASVVDRRQNARKQYAKNPTKHLMYQKKWRIDHKESVDAYHKKWRDANPEKVRAYGRRAAFLQRLVRYGITEEQYNNMLAAQNYSCAACGTMDPGILRGWHTDHNHATGKVRGILCQGCNLIIGHAKDSPARLVKVAKYLELYR